MAATKNRGSQPMARTAEQDAAVQALLLAFSPHQLANFSPVRTSAAILTTEALAAEFGVTAELIDGAREAGCPHCTVDGSAPLFELNKVLAWLQKESEPGAR